MNNHYRSIGFLFMTDRRHFTDAAMYGDWVDQVWSKQTLNEDLYMGILPNGLMLEGPKGIVVVTGPCGVHDQKLKPVEKILKISGNGNRNGNGNDNKKNERPKNGELDPEELKKLRLRFEMTQQDLAIMAGLSTATVGNVESYRLEVSKLRVNTLHKLKKTVEKLREKERNGEKETHEFINSNQ